MSVHGGNIEEVARMYKFNPEEIVDFSANINPMGLSENVKKAMINSIDKVIKYPDITYFDLKNSISNFEDINSQNIILGNGAAEAIFNIVRALKPKKALLPAPTFSEYEEAILSVNGEIKYYKLKEKNNFLVVVFMVLTSGSLLVGPDIIHVMTEQEYWYSIYAFIPLTISVFINFMYIFSVGVEYFCKKTGYISLTTLICTIANVILNYFLIIQFGYIAAAYATCLSKLFLFILHYIRAKKLLTEDIVSLKCLNINLFVVCLTGILTIIFIDNIFVRYLFIGVLLFLTMRFIKSRKID